MALDIYGYWDTDLIADTLNAVVNILGGDGSYTGLLKSIAIVGLFVAVGTGLARAQGQHAVVYLVMLGVWYFALLVPKTTVIIREANQIGYVKTVDNVPLGLAVFASTTSHIGHWLTQSFETFFAMPDDLKFQQNGFLFGSRLLESRQNARVTDPRLYADFVQYMKNCVYDEIGEDPAALIALRDSPNLIDDLAPYMNPGRLVMITNPTTGVIEGYDCQTAHITNIVPRLNAETTVVEGKLHAYMNWRNPTAAISSQLENSDAYLINVSQTAAMGLRQAIMLNVFKDTPKDIAALSGDAAGVAVEVAAVQASTQSNVAYALMRKIGESVLPVVRSLLNIMIIAVFPIIMILVIMAGAKGGIVLMSYLKALIFVQLWAPLYAISNFMYSKLSLGEVSSLIAVSSPGGVSMGVTEVLNNGLISGQAIAGLLTLMVPTLALAIIKGGEVAMSGVASGLTSPASSTAQSAGSQAAMGNLQAGNTQWGNVTMHDTSGNNLRTNQQNSAPTNTHGAATDTQSLPGGSTITSIGGAPGVLNQSGTVPNLGVLSANAASLLQNSFQTKSTESASNAAMYSATKQSSVNTALDQIKDFSTGNRGSTRVGTDSQLATMSQFVQGTDNAQQTAANWNAGVKLSDTQKFQIMSSVSAGGGIPGFIRAEMKANGSSESQINASLDSARAYSESSGFREQTQQTQNLGNTIATSTGSESYMQATKGIRASLSQANSASELEQASLQQARSYEQASTLAETRGGGASVNLSRFIQDELGGAAAANSILAGMTDAQKLAYGQGMADNFVARLAHQTQYGDPDSNAGISTLAKSDTPSLDQTPKEFAAGATSETRAQHADNQAAVPGNADAAPSVKVGGQTVTPQTVKDAERAGQTAADIQLADGQNATDSGRKAVAAPVQEQTEEPNIIGRAGDNSFAGGKPQDGNPAAKPKNTGGASGEW